MKTRRLLGFYLSIMALMIVYALIRPESFKATVMRPDLYLHAKFIHVLSVTLLFANAVIGTLWEVRSLLSSRPEIIRYTYQTVVWLDAVFTAPLIIIAVLSGIMLGTILGGVWSIGWLSVAFVTFIGTGLVWIVADIPTQYRVNRLFDALGPEPRELPRELRRVLWFRMGVNAMGVLPLLFVFFLMVHKPQMPSVGSWWKTVRTAWLRNVG